MSPSASPHPAETPQAAAARDNGSALQEPEDLRAHTDFDPRASAVTGVEEEVFEQLLQMRRTIDNIDAALVHLLAERFRATQRVGWLKARHELPAGDPDREAAQIRRLRGLAEAADLDPEFAEKFLNFIISEVIRHHESIARAHGGDGADGADGNA